MGWMQSKNTTTTQVAPEMRAAQATAMNYATNAANQPFQQYQGAWSAPSNYDQGQGLTGLRNSANVGAAEMAQAAGGAGGAMRYQPMMTSASTGGQFAGQYFNPFLKNVVGGMTDEMGRARTMQVNADEDKALAAGAYGGSRHGVMDAETTRGFFDTLGRNVGDLYARGFDTAQGLGQQDASRQLQSDQGNQQTHLGGGQLRLSGADTMARIGDARHDNYLDSARAQFDAGSTMRTFDQASIDRERERFNEWRDYPMRQSQIINSAAGLVQGGQTQTQTRSPGLAEIALTMAPFMIMKSDRNVKSDVGGVSDRAVLKGFANMKAKTWRYDPRKGGPNDGGKKHIGPMAQGVKRNLGFGTGTDIPIIDMLGAQSAAISALARKVDRKNVSDVKIKRKGK